MASKSKPSPLSPSSGVNLSNSNPKLANRASIDTPFGTDFSFELSGGLEGDALDDAHHPSNNSDIVSLDPEVLASLVIQLRTNLASSTRERNELREERDGLIGDLATIQTRLQELEGAHEREVAMINEMTVWKKRCEEAEEQVALLRAKVEESRRAVMTLQTQSRRLSQLSVPYGSGSPTQSTFGQDATGKTPAFLKRRSFQVGTTFNHGPAHTSAPPTASIIGPVPPNSRRKSATSEPGDTPSAESQSSHVPSSASIPDESTPVSTTAPSAFRGQNHQDDHDAAARRASRRHSAMMGGRPTESLLNPMGAELENLRQELIAVRMELMESKQELWETKEAKEASDVCLKALKEFINENNIGDGTAPAMGGISLPPLPTDQIADDEDEDGWNKTPVATHTHSASISSISKKWGLGFWNPLTAANAATNAGDPNPSTTTKGPNARNDAVSQSSQSPQSSTLTTSSFSNLVSKWRRADPTNPSPGLSIPSTSSTSNPSPSASTTSTITGYAHALSPSQSMSTIGAVFNRWSSPTSNSSSPKAQDDNFTPAPGRGSIRRRASAYSTSTGYSSEGSRVDTHSQPGYPRRADTLFDAGNRYSMEPESYTNFKPQRRVSSLSTASSLSTMSTTSHRESISSVRSGGSGGSRRNSPDSSGQSLLDSTPSLTDAETVETVDMMENSGSDESDGHGSVRDADATPKRAIKARPLVGYGISKSPSPRTSLLTPEHSQSLSHSQLLSPQQLYPSPQSLSPSSQSLSPSSAHSLSPSTQLSTSPRMGLGQPRSRGSSIMLSPRIGMATIDESNLERSSAADS